VRRGDACAFSTDIEDGDQVVVLVQASAGDADVRDALIGTSRQTVRETAGIDCASSSSPGASACRSLSGKAQPLARQGATAGGRLRPDLPAASIMRRNPACHC
jgi:hypothetical protein